MKKEATKQVNWRLPVSLVEKIDRVIEETGESRTDIVREAIEQKVTRKERQIERQKEKATVV